MILTSRVNELPEFERNMVETFIFIENLHALAEKLKKSERDYYKKIKKSKEEK